MVLNNEKSLFAFILLSIFIILTCKSFSSEKEEALYSFNYNKYSVDLIVYIERDSVYVPLQDILSVLKIYYEVDSDNKYSGYVNNADSSFVIDFKSKSIVDISGQKFSISSKQWFAGDLQIFVRTDLIASVFKVEFINRFNSLSVSLNSKYEMPLLRKIRSDERLKNFQIEKDEEVSYPLIQKPDFTFLNGGVLDYNLSTTYSNDNLSYNFSNNIGLEVLDGEFQYNINGRMYSDKLNYEDRYRWRYLADHKYFQSLSLGHIENSSSRGYNSRGYRKPMFRLMGASISNENQKMVNLFSNIIIEDRTEPGWNVELYISNQLYDVQKSDMNGIYKFDIPLTYGSTDIKVKIYGPKGEFITSEKLINIPSNFLIPGEFKYTLSSGVDELTSDIIVDGNFNIGVTKWFSTGFTIFSDINKKNYEVINVSSINLFNNFPINLLATSTNIYEIGFKLPNDKLGNWDINYTYYGFSDNANQISSLNIMSSINRPFNLPFSLSFIGYRNDFENYSTNNLSSNLNMYYSGLNFSVRHNLSYNKATLSENKITQYLAPNISYSLSNIEDYIYIFNRIKITASTSIDLDKYELSTINTNFQASINRDISLNGTYSYSPTIKQSSFKLAFNMNLNTLRSNSSGSYYQGRSPIYSADISGSLEFDSENRRISLLSTLGSSSLYGKSSAAIRFFNDKNYNLKYDSDELLIPEVDFIIIGSNLVKKNDKGQYKTITNLIPNTKYNIKVNEESFSNELMVASITEFSFIAEPYSYKSIDIPCHMSGMLEGSISKKEGNSTKGQSGLRVHIDSEKGDFNKEVLVFSDGSYYFSGLPIGNYRVSVDSLQLKILNCQSNPADYQITIKSSVDGDLVGNINFILNKLDSTTIDKQKAEILPGTALITAGSQPNIEELVNDNIRKNQTIEGSVVVDQPANSKNYIIQFSTKNTTILDIKGTEVLDLITDYLLKNPLLFIDIQGHSCKLDSTELEQNIAIERAATVKNYLISKGIDASKMNIKSVGSSNPLHDNNSEVGKIRNSRVEINIIEK